MFCSSNFWFEKASRKNFEDAIFITEIFAFYSGQRQIGGPSINLRELTQKSPLLEIKIIFFEASDAAVL